jgi:TPR repeat protein
MAALLLSTSSFVFSADLPFNSGLKLYLKGEVEQAVKIWNEIAEQGDIQAQKQLGQYYMTNNEQRDYAKSIQWYRRAAEQGDKEAAGHQKNAEILYAKWKQLANEIGAQAASDTITFREHIVEGDDTHCGFVIEVKSKVVLVQTQSQPRWFKKEDLYRPADKTCTH